MMKDFLLISRFVRVVFWVTCMAAVFTINAGAEVIYVKQHSGLVKDGASWDTAYTDLQEAIDSAGETAGVKDEVWVAAGTYKPASQPNIDPDEANARYRHFSLKNNVSVLGGFAGTETSLESRDIDANPTIISGDYGTYNECYNVFYHPSGTDLDNTAVLDGVTITGGNANGIHAHGGGMYNNGSSPVISNCIFTGNEGGYGAGMGNDSSSPKLTNCTFSNNAAVFDGGGIDNRSSSAPVLTDCTFSENSAGEFGGGGGGMYNYDSSPELTNCTFTGNKTKAEDDDDAYGGGMHNYNSTLTLTFCRFNGNEVSAEDRDAPGGGMCNRDSSLTLTGCEFIGNNATTVSSAYDADGGGMYNRNSSLSLVNCIFSMNKAKNNGGGIYNVSSSPTLTNCILWNNTADTGNEIFNSDAGSSPAISYCNIKESGGSGSWTGDPGADGGNNIDIDPMLVRNPGAIGSGDYGDLHLQSGSLCIDSGDNSAANLPDKDIDGEMRIYNSRVDMGVDEFTDFDGDGTADYKDQCDYDPDKIYPGVCGCGVADIDSDGDGTPDCNDLCPDDPGKTAPGACGCGVADIDSDGDGILDCNENCPDDPEKVDPGGCGCGVADIDSDGDGALDCNDICPDDPGKIDPGACGCGVADIDLNGNGVPDCQDRENWPSELDLDGNGVPDRDQDDIMVVYSAAEDLYFGIIVPDEEVLEYLEWIDEATITDDNGRPDATFPLGLVRFRIQTSEPGKAIQLPVYCSTQIPEDAVWYKYDPIIGWYDYSSNVTVNEDGLSAIIFLEDGGIGDTDGLINGFIEDPIGPALLEGDGHHSGGGCFLGTAGVAPN